MDTTASSSTGSSWTHIDYSSVPELAVSNSTQVLSLTRSFITDGEAQSTKSFKIISKNNPNSVFICCN